MNTVTHLRVWQNRPTIGLLLRAFNDDHQSDIWNGMREAAYEHKVNLLCFTGGSIGYGSDESFHQQRNVLYELILGLQKYRFQIMKAIFQ